MIWLVLWIIWTFFEELNNSLLKEKSKKYHYVTVWVIMSCFSLLVFVSMWLYKYYSWDLELIFNSASIPLLFVRLIFEILQSYFTLIAIKQCDRSTFSILRVLTIPLLVIADILLWYQFTAYSLIWIWIILFSFIWFNTKHKTINWKWWYFALFTAINAVITLSLFKYSITNYWNSLEIDQWIMALWTVIFFIWYNLRKEKKNRIIFIKKRENILDTMNSYGYHINSIKLFLPLFKCIRSNSSKACLRNVLVSISRFCIFSRNSFMKKNIIRIMYNNMINYHGSVKINLIHVKVK